MENLLYSVNNHLEQATRMDQKSGPQTKIKEIQNSQESNIKESANKTIRKNNSIHKIKVTKQT